jgi:hypothetical protein
MGGDIASAQKTAILLNQPGGPTGTLPQVVALLVDKTAPPADWQKKVQSAGLPENAIRPVLAYGFFLRGNYDEAAKIWQQVNDASHGADLQARVMLTASLDRAGNSASSKVALMPFAPEFADLYAAVSFTELRRLLAKGQ